MPGLALKQWTELQRVLAETLSAEVQLIDAKPGLPDMVFTANAGVVWQNKFIVSNFRHEVRRGEAAHFAQWFRARGVEIVHLPKSITSRAKATCCAAVSCGLLDTISAPTCWRTRRRAEIVGQGNTFAGVDQPTGFTTSIPASARCRTKPRFIPLPLTIMRKRYWKIIYPV